MKAPMAWTAWLLAACNIDDIEIGISLGTDSKVKTLFK